MPLLVVLVSVGGLGLAIAGLDAYSHRNYVGYNVKTTEPRPRNDFFDLVVFVLGFFIIKKYLVKLKKIFF